MLTSHITHTPLNTEHVHRAIQINVQEHWPLFGDSQSCFGHDDVPDQWGQHWPCQAHRIFADAFISGLRAAAGDLVVGGRPHLLERWRDDVQIHPLDNPVLKDYGYEDGYYFAVAYPAHAVEEIIDLFFDNH